MPRLTIWYLLLWTTISGVLAARISSRPFSIPLALNVAITGGALTVTAIVIYSCFRHGLWAKTEPGHWFAFVAAWEYLDMIAVTPACVAWVPIEEGYLYCVAFLGMAVIYVAGAVVGRWEWYWRVAILAHGLDAIAAVAWRITNEWGSRDATEVIRTGVTPVIGVVAVAFVSSSMGADLYRKRYRDWLHWVGMAYFLLKWYGLIRAYVVPYFFPR